MCSNTYRSKSIWFLLSLLFPKLKRKSSLSICRGRSLAPASLLRPPSLVLPLGSPCITRRLLAHSPPPSLAYLLTSSLLSYLASPVGKHLGVAYVTHLVSIHFGPWFTSARRGQSILPGPRHLLSLPAIHLCVVAIWRLSQEPGHRGHDWQPRVRS